MNYRRIKPQGVCYFFTINLENRKSTLLIDEIDKLKKAIKIVKSKHPFKIDGVVVMPEHLHMVITLPVQDVDYSKRLSLIKSNFSRAIQLQEPISISRKKKRERGIWQRRFWEHLIRDDNDYEQHINYIHYNPVKHGYVNKPIDWKYTSLHRYIQLGIVPENWACDELLFKSQYGEG